MDREKRYVPVLVRFDAEGKMRPVEIEFEEGQVFAVDCILDVRRLPARASAVSVTATPAGSWARRRTCGLKKDAGLWRQKFDCRTMSPSMNRQRVHGWAHYTSGF